MTVAAVIGSAGRALDLAATYLARIDKAFHGRANRSR
jgi:hypothetical protein